MALLVGGERRRAVCKEPLREREPDRRARAPPERGILRSPARRTSMVRWLLPRPRFYSFSLVRSAAPRVSCLTGATASGPIRATNAAISDRAATSHPHAAGWPPGFGRGLLPRVDPATGALMLLFIRRAINPRDPWSGNVAFPGGKQDPDDGDDDERTAMRETQEEVGLDLHSWRRLGRLTEDKTIRPRGKKTMVISLFGFILESDEHTPLRPEPGEVADAWWVPADLLCPERVEWRSHPNPNPNPNPNPKPNPDPDPNPVPNPNPNPNPDPDPNPNLT